MGSKAVELLERVKSQITKVIVNGVGNGSITEERAKIMASKVLSSLKDKVTYNEIISIIPTLDDEFTELAEAISPIMLEYEEKMRKIINKKISDLLKNQKYNEAAKLSKKAIEFEKGLG